MVFRTIDEILEKASALKTPRAVAVAGSELEHVLEAVLMAQETGFAEPWLIGRKAQTQELVQKLGGRVSDERYIDISSNDPNEIAAEAVRLVKSGAAQAIMKGKVNTSELLRAALNKQTGLEHSKVVTSFAFAQIPGYHKLVVFNDSGIIPYPTFEQKTEQIRLVSEALRNMGYDEEIKIAALAPAEDLNPKIPESVESAKLKELCESGAFPGCLIEGPISFDLAMDKEAAVVKGYSSPVAGDADVLLFPNLSSGNFTSKMLQLFAGGITIGMALGAGAPIAMSSRAASTRAKYCSLAMAVLSAKEV